MHKARLNLEKTIFKPKNERVILNGTENVLTACVINNVTRVLNTILEQISNCYGQIKLN